MSYENRTAHTRYGEVLPVPTLDDRVSVQVKDENGDPFSCAVVYVDGQSFPASTYGRLWLFPSLDDVSSSIDTWGLHARAPDGSCPTDCSDEFTSDTRSATPHIVLQIPQVSLLPSKLDNALVMDTTGSMCDELDYLKAEIHSVIESSIGISGSTREIDVRVAIVLYRDDGDEYLVDFTDFSSVDTSLSALQSAGCDGGGDYPEASGMDEAMLVTTSLEWRTGNVARVAFLVADAPPHDENLKATLEAALGLRHLGVRLYGVAASGVAETAEYMMRLMSMVTGARYTWLTDDSGIGNSYAEPKVECYQVTHLDNLLVRILQGELLGRRVEANESDIIREVGSQEGGFCIVDVDPSSPDEGPPPCCSDSTGAGESTGGGTSLRREAMFTALLMTLVLFLFVS